MAQGDVYKMTVIWDKTAVQNKAVNIFYWKWLSGALVFDTPEEDLVGAFIEECAARYASFVTSVLAVREIKVGIQPDFGTSYAVTLPGIAGQLTGDPLPVRTAGLLQLKTANLTKRGRGRIYLPPASESVSGNGAPTQAFLDNQADTNDTFLTAMNSTTVTHASWQLCMFSKADNVFRPVTSIVIAPFWASQRDRKNLL